MIPGVNLSNVTIVLQGPRYPENIGAAARAMRNMGIEQLRVVNPENYDLPRVLKLATHAAADVVAQMTRHETLEAALADLQWVVGTTARLGGERRTVLTPPVVAEKLISISRKNQVGILFGPEDRGLTNEDLRLCHALVNIPTADFSSLNLAQAVMVMCYALRSANSPAGPEPTPRLASRLELDGMYEQVKELLVRINYIQPENPDYWMNKMRHFFSRIQIRAGEVSIIRGICRQVNWYGKKCYEQGTAAGLPEEKAKTMD